MKKGGGSESTIIVGPSKSVLVYALHSLEYVLGLGRFRVFVPKLYYYIILYYVCTDIDLILQLIFDTIFNLRGAYFSYVLKI